MPFLLRDRLYLRRQADAASGEEILLARPTGFHSIRNEGPYFAGPAAARVAVIDFDAESGALRPPAQLHPKGRSRLEYTVDEAALDPDASVEAFDSDAFIQVSTFATVMRTLAFFEQADMLGRRVEWAFPSAQLLVVPRAGVMANAFYERESGSLQFFSYPGRDGTLHHTSLSSDIVTHETTHAVLDGIVPDLYDAVTPQSLAIHEAIADLSAICANLLNESIVFSLFNISGGLLDVSSALSRVAEEFGSDMRIAVGADYLRVANNGRTLDPSDLTLDAAGQPNSVDRVDAHALSEVLSGALYQTFLRAGEAVKPRRADTLDTADEQQVAIAARRLARLVFPALDYLPPGELSFIDVGRAIVAFHTAAHRRGAEPQWLVDELVRRKVAPSADRITDVPADFAAKEVAGVDLDALVGDDDTARTFAEQHRGFLGIPRRRRFEVLPRHVAVRSTTRRGAPSQREVVFRVRWRENEAHDVGEAFDRRWSVAAGTTLVIDQQSRRVKSLLTTDGGTEHADDREIALRRLADDGLLATSGRGTGPDGRPRTDVLVTDPKAGVQRVTGGARLLHVVGGGW